MYNILIIKTNIIIMYVELNWDLFKLSIYKRRVMKIHSIDFGMIKHTHRGVFNKNVKNKKQLFYHFNQISRMEKHYF